MFIDVIEFKRKSIKLSITLEQQKEDNHLIHFNAILDKFDYQYFDFAVYAVLPVAMRIGENIKTNLPVTSKCINFAQKTSRAWHYFLENHFQSVQIVSQSVVENPKYKQRDPRNCMRQRGRERERERDTREREREMGRGTERKRERRSKEER